MSLEVHLEVDDLDPETVQKRFGDIELESELVEDIEEARRILRALVKKEGVARVYILNMAVDLMDWEDEAGRWRSGINQISDGLHARERTDDYPDLLRAAVRGNSLGEEPLLERLISEGIDRGVGFPACTELAKAKFTELESSEGVNQEKM